MVSGGKDVERWWVLVPFTEWGVLRGVGLFLLEVFGGRYCCVGNPRALPTPLSGRRRRAIITRLHTNSRARHRLLVARGLHLIICVTGGFSNYTASARSLISVNAVKLVGTIGAFGPGGGVGLTACTSHYVRGRVLVRLHGVNGTGLRVDFSRPLDIS